MTWCLTPTDNLDQVLDLYHAVFKDTLTPEEYRQRTDGFRVFCYMIQRGDEKPAGFAVFRCHEQEAELWQAGILPERRRQDAGTSLLDQGEQFMTRLGYTRLIVETYNHWNIMISMLTRKGYRIRDTQYSARREDLKITLQKELKIRREMRYALTERCNFNCLFCHNEGLGHEERAAVSDEYIANVLEEAVRLGHTDITFTGGEPLLKKKRLQYLLNRLGKLSDPPAVTVVTNGSMLDDPVIGWLRDYPGKTKINLSLHATTEPLFRKITGVKADGMFRKVVDNVRKASSAGLTVKVNHVVLQNLNHRHLTDAVSLARSLGASAIKFLELLVLEDRENDYAMYYDFRAIQNHLQSIADGPEQLNLRQFRYRHKEDSQFIIEVSRLTCALGCSCCRESRDRTFSSNGSYHPCFVRHKKHYTIQNPGQLREIFATGDRIIDGYAAKFGDSSPTLILREKFVSDKREFFFRIREPDRFVDFIKQQRFQLKNTLGFHLEYFWPTHRAEHWTNFERMLKIGWDHHDQSKVDLLYTDHRYIHHPEVGLETITRFLDSSGPMSFPTYERALHFLDRTDFEKYLELEWRFQIYKRQGIELSIALAGEKSSVKISGTVDAARLFLDAVQTYPGFISPLYTPLVKFMMGDAVASDPVQ
jgi:GTP 3',8-cyclase